MDVSTFLQGALTVGVDGLFTETLALLGGLALVGGFAMALVNFLKATPLRWLILRYLMTEEMRRHATDAKVEEVEKYTAEFITGPKLSIFYDQEVPAIFAGIGSVRTFAFAQMGDDVHRDFIRLWLPDTDYAKKKLEIALNGPPAEPAAKAAGEEPQSPVAQSQRRDGADDQGRVEPVGDDCDSDDPCKAQKPCCKDDKDPDPCRPIPVCKDPSAGETLQEELYHWRQVARTQQYAHLVCEADRKVKAAAAAADKKARDDRAAAKSAAKDVVKTLVEANISGAQIRVGRRWNLCKQVAAMAISVLIVFGFTTDPALLVPAFFAGLFAPFAHDLIKLVKAARA